MAQGTHEDAPILETDENMLHGLIVTKVDLPCNEGVKSGTNGGGDGP